MKQIRLEIGLCLVLVLGMVSGQAASFGQADDMTYKIVTFGTSLTERGGWQLPLQDALSKCLGRPVLVDSVARSGATSEWALEKIGDVIAAKPDVVLVEFYANDAALNRFMTVGRSRQNMAMILGQLKQQLPHARIIVMGMNPIFGLRGFIRPFINSYIDAHRQLAIEMGLDFYDNQPAWAELSPDELAAAIPDGSHPLPPAASTVIVPGLTQEIASGKCQN
ncbi:SGNH/GDSL hydrolase family protein [Rhizobium leguminosarum]|uniref:SGNH/GDSL hydrolase family protein n=1 Tax=Rhizobium leguminosarum TaxID=384 RepID=UPI003F981E11